MAQKVALFAPISSTPLDRQRATISTIGKTIAAARKRPALFFECFPYVCPEPVLAK